MSVAGTPYDDAFRTLLNDCPQLILPVLNDTFHEHYTGKEQIVFLPNEHFLNRKDGEEQKRITDSCFCVIGKSRKKYHAECQATIDHSILVRIFEYDTQIALDDGELKDNTLTVTFPHTAVLFLRHRETTPDTMTIRMIVPGGEVSYEVRVIKLQRYSLDEIFSKGLLFFLPFYIFSHENSFPAYERSEEALGNLRREYQRIVQGMEELERAEKVNTFTKLALYDMGIRVLESIAKNYPSVKKEVKAIMGGKILEYEAKTIRNEGMAQGMAQGMEKMKQLIQCLIDDGKSDEIPAVLADEARQEEMFLRYNIT